MIEQTMQELKDEMAELRSAIADLTAAMQAAPQPQKEKKVDKSAAPKQEAVPVEEDKADAPVISRDDLQDLCMVIVRKDRSKKADVKAAIASFGGAKTLKDVAEQDLDALHKKLGAL